MYHDINDEDIDNCINRNWKFVSRYNKHLSKAQIYDLNQKWINLLNLGINGLVINSFLQDIKRLKIEECPNKDTEIDDYYLYHYSIFAKDYHYNRMVIMRFSIPDDIPNILNYSKY